MVKDTTGLMGVYAAIGVLSLLIAYMAYDHVQMMRMLHDKKKLCKLVASCKIEPFGREPKQQKMAKPAPIKLKQDFGPAPVHHRWADCLNDMKAQGRTDLAGFIHQQMQRHGDQPLLAVPGGCSGAGCPHDLTSCDNYWANYASSMQQ